MLAQSDIVILARAVRFIAPGRWGFWRRGTRPEAQTADLAARGLVSIEIHADRHQHFVSITALGLEALAAFHPAAVRRPWAGSRHANPVPGAA